jgi:hypothetical protein
MEIPMYQLFYEGKQAPRALNLPRQKSTDAWGSNGKSARMLGQFRRLLSKVTVKDQKFLLLMAQKMAELTR